MLTKLEKRVVSSIQQDDIAIIERPYLKIAKRLGITEEVLLKTMTNLCERGIIRRFGATLRHQKSGFAANVMIAWKADKERIDEVGQKMASFKQVSHCYERNPAKNWPYNLYTMVHAADETSCREIARKISLETSIKEYTLLFSRKELKKTSMEYFPQKNA